MRPTKNIVIRDRDLKLFNYLFKNKIANAKQINRDIFDHCKMTATYKRLRKLEKHLFIESNVYKSQGQAKRAFSLTSKSFKNYIQQDGDIKLRKQLKSDKPNHDLCLVDIQYRLELCQTVVKYIPENILQSYSGQINFEFLEDFSKVHTDAYVRVKLTKGYYNLALEYEASFKHSYRYPQKIRSYYNNTSIDGVLIICKDKFVLENLKSAERSLGENSSPIMFYALIENVLNSEKEIHFQNINGNVLTIT